MLAGKRLSHSDESPSSAPEEFMTDRTNADSPHTRFSGSYDRLTHSHASRATSPGETVSSSKTDQRVRKRTEERPRQYHSLFIYLWLLS